MSLINFSIMYVNSVEIKNLRCFRETRIELQHPDRDKNLRFPNINLLLGNNGSGKSTILRAIALATLYPVLQKNSGLVLYRLIRDTGRKDELVEDAFLNAEISLHQQDLGNSKLRFPTVKLNSSIHRSGDIEELSESNSQTFSKLRKKNTVVSNPTINKFTVLENFLKDRLSPKEDTEDINQLSGSDEIRNWEESEKKFSELLEIEPENIHARIELSKIYTKQRKFEAAKEVLSQLLENDKNNIQARIEFSKIYRKQRAWKEAEDILLENIKIDPNELNSRIELSKLYLTQKKWKEAENILLEFLSANKDNVQVRIELSNLHQRQGKFVKAEHSLFEALLIDPKQSLPLIELSKIYLRKGNLEEAAIALKESFEIESISENKHNQAIILGLLGQVYQHHRKYDEAINVLTRSLEIGRHTPDYRHHAVVLNSLGEVFQRQRKYNEAIEVLSQSFEIEFVLGNKHGQAAVLRSVGDVYLELGFFDEAVEFFERSLKIAFETRDLNQQANLLNSLGIIHREQGRLQEAVEVFEKGLDMMARLNNKRGQTMILNSLGEVYQRQGRFEEAKKILLESLKIDPEQISPRTNLIKLYKLHGNLEEAASILDQSSLEEIIKEMYEDYSPAFLMVGYGVTRRFDDTINYNFKEQSRNRRLRYSRVASLFEGSYGLIPLNSWLPEMESTNNGYYTQVVHLIDRLTPDDVKFEGEFINEEFYCNFRGAKIPFGALSDGYRNYLGWIGDLLYHICMGAPSGKKLVATSGVVLVDEIDLLLHPEWQRTVIQSLSENFPNMQFVFTTHSPIVASSVEKENVFVMETEPDGSAVVRQYKEFIYGLTAEEVLLSSYFGLETTRPESVVKERYKPASNKAVEGSHEDALEFLRRLNTPPEADKAKLNDISEDN